MLSSEKEENSKIMTATTAISKNGDFFNEILKEFKKVEINEALEQIASDLSKYSRKYHLDAPACKLVLRRCIKFYLEDNELNKLENDFKNTNPVRGINTSVVKAILEIKRAKSNKIEADDIDLVLRACALNLTKNARRRLKSIKNRDVDVDLASCIFIILNLIESFND